jgi:heterodisulfide reductase subunit A-like polyferredoxin
LNNIDNLYVPLTQSTVTEKFSDETNSDKLVEIEGDRLVLEKERIKVEQQRLDIEQENLNIDRQRFFIEQQKHQLNINLSQMGIQVAGQHTDISDNTAGN